MSIARNEEQPRLVNRMQRPVPVRTRPSRTDGVRLSRHRSYWRLFWFAVLLLHAPITIDALSSLGRVDSGETSWNSLILLTLSNLFFIGEIVFAYSLHLLSDRRRMVAFLAVVALLHVGVIERGMPQWLRDRDTQALMVVATVGAAVCHERLWRAMSRLCGGTRLPDAPGPHLALSRYAARFVPIPRPRLYLFGPRFIPPRAPPFPA